jgi:hypothetical protein
MFVTLGLMRLRCHRSSTTRLKIRRRVLSYVGLFLDGQSDTDIWLLNVFLLYCTVEGEMVILGH